MFAATLKTSNSFDYKDEAAKAKYTRIQEGSGRSLTIKTRQIIPDRYEESIGEAATL